MSIECKYCEEKISIKSETFIQYLTSDYILRLKYHIHLKKHNKKYLTIKGLIKSLIVFLLALIGTAMILPIWLITFPFWWLHEIIN
jgi:hypothetical protein